MKIWDNIVRLIGFESDESKLNRFNEIKKSYDEVQLSLDNLAEDFLIEKSNYKKRLFDPDNQSIKLRIKEKWDSYLKDHRQEIQKAKKDYDNLKKEIEKFESTDLIKKNQETQAIQIIKKAYQTNLISLDDYNKVINKSTKREKTLYSDFILFNENYEVLLLKRSTWDMSNPGVWVLPGGHVDSGEDHLTAAKRELIEETGYDVYCDKIDVTNVGSYDDNKCHIEYFQATINQSEQTPNLQWEEVRDVKWVPVNELKEYEMVFNMKENLLKILNLPNEEKTEIKKSDIVKSELDNLYSEFTKELLVNIRKRNFLIEKGFTKEANNIDNLIEKAKKDLSKLTKIKKLIYRDGKLILSTYHVKTGEHVIPDGLKEAPAGVITEDVTTGDKLEIRTGKGEDFEGTVVSVEVDDKTGFAWTQIILDDGRLKWVNLSKVRRFQKKDKSPIDTSVKEVSDIPELFDLKYEKVLGGSSSVELQSDKDGNLFVVKKSHKGDFNQLVNEFEVNNIYRSLGFRVSEQRLDEKSNTLISKFLEGHKELGHATISVKDGLINEIKQGFVLDCLLANWDVLGQNEDNILFSHLEDKMICRIDNGGSLQYRAKGGIKEFDNSVSEIRTLREHEPGKTIYASITDDDIKNQVSKLLKDIDKIKVSDKLKDHELINKTLISRLNWLSEEYLSKETKEEPKDKLRSDMPSLVTQKYFDEKYDKLVNINGNKGIKEHIRKKILDIEYKNKTDYEIYAKEQGMTVEEFKADLQKTIEEIVSKSKGYIVAHSAVSGKISGKSHGVVGAVLSEKRFKTQFETGTSSGCLDRSTRAEEEDKYFGFNLATEDKSNRPIYGFFTDQEHGAINKEGTIPPERNVSMYGDICFEVKDEKFRRDGTVTFRDSLGSARDIVASPVSAPHFTSINPRYYKTIKGLQREGVKGDEHGSYGYVETQYHGQLKLDNIEKIHVSIDNYGDKRRLNDVVNEVIQYTTIGGEPIHLELF